jgi:hypothetical protein
LTDFTEQGTTEGKIYHFAIKEFSPNRVDGCVLDDRMKTSLAVRALCSAICLSNL